MKAIVTVVSFHEVQIEDFDFDSDDSYMEAIMAAKDAWKAGEGALLREVADDVEFKL